MYGGYLSGLNFPGVEGRLSRWEIVVNIVPLKEAIIALGFRQKISGVVGVW
jgi:hypothetical protein